MSDYFTFLGVPRKLNLDATDLDQRFRTLSRQFHPDYFYNAPAADRIASLERSSYLNDAYRTLRDAASRVAYLLEIEGFGAAPASANGAQRASKEVPPALLEEVFALNEELDEVRSLRAEGAPSEQLRLRLDRARAPIEAKQREHEQDLHALAAEWDALVGNGSPDSERRRVLTALRQRMLERNYINNLLAGIERERVG